MTHRDLARPARGGLPDHRSLGGAGGSGRLGDGGTATRPEPAAVFSGLLNWIPAAPSVSLASGTLDEPATVTVASAMPGAIVRYTRTGAAPTALDDEVPANGQLEIGYSSMLRARAFAAGRVPGLLARADYALQSGAPSISPGSGTYTTAQVVTLSVTAPPSEIRYTLDGSEPTSASPLYVEPISITTATTVKARGFPLDGWSPSPTSVATFILDYGVLDAPVASPAGGIYGFEQMVTLTAPPGATIRYTLNGTDPTAASAVYAAPIQVASGTLTIHARAFHPDWTESAVHTQVYTIDTAVPTIVAQRFPLPIGNWHRTPVTISFLCADNAGIAFCSSPATVSVEGAAQTVTGTAVDEVGLQATIEETVNVDLTPPVLSLTAPVDGLVTTSTSVVVTGEVTMRCRGWPSSTATVSPHPWSTAPCPAPCRCGQAATPSR